MDIFNITLEFDHDVFRQKIYDGIAAKKAGYVCVVDGNVLSQAQKVPSYGEIIRNAYVNTCDSAYIAVMANDIYGTNYTSLNGPMLFNEFIEKPYKQLLLGNTQETYNKICYKLKERTGDDSMLHYLGLPFATVEDFDYTGIAKFVNVLQPDIIWVSLGAPKQEKFMSRLLPHINQGIMFGIGAAFNYYSGDQAYTKAEIGPYRLLWLQRIFQEPKKQIRRCWNFLTVIPSLKRQEKKKFKDSQKKRK